MIAIDKQTEKQARWRERVDEQMRSGLSVADYCHRHGLSVTSFYGWKSRLGKSGKSRVLALSNVAKPSPFIELGSVREVSALNSVQEPGSCLDVRLDLGLGMVLTITRR